MSNRLRTWFKTGIILASLLFFVFVIQSEQSRAEFRLITIGAILPLTGNSAFLGHDESKVLQLLQKTYHPNQRTIQVSIEDNKSTQKDAVTAYYKLKNTGTENFILSLTRSVESVAPIGDSDRCVMMGLSMSPQIAERSRFLFRMYYGMEAQFDTLIEYMRERKLETLAVLYVETPELSAGYIDVLPKRITSRSADIKIVAMEPFGFSGQEIKSAMAKIAYEDPDVIMVEDYGALYPQILETANIHGMKNRLVGGIGFTGIAPQNIGKFIGIPFIAPQELISPTTEYQYIMEQFEKEYGSKPLVGIDVLYTYYSFVLLADALAQQDDEKRNPERTVSLIHENAVKMGLDLKSDGTFYFPAAMAVFENGGIVELK